MQFPKKANFKLTQGVVSDGLPSDPSLCPLSAALDNAINHLSDNKCKLNGYFISPSFATFSFIEYDGDFERHIVFNLGIQPKLEDWICRFDKREEVAPTHVEIVMRENKKMDNDTIIEGVIFDRSEDANP